MWAYLRRSNLRVIVWSCLYLFIFGAFTNFTALCGFYLLRLIRGRVVFVNVYALGVYTSASGLWHFFFFSLVYKHLANLHEEIKIMVFVGPIWQLCLSLVFSFYFSLYLNHSCFWRYESCLILLFFWEYSSIHLARFFNGKVTA